MDCTETRIKRINRYEGIIINLQVDQVRLANDALTMREVVEHPGGVAIVAIDAERNVYCVEQFRYPLGKMLFEIPAGKLEKGEDPEECAYRELSEETGLNAGRMTSLGKIFTSPGFSNETLYLYMAEELVQNEAHPDANELLNIKKLPFDELVSMVVGGEISDAKTVAAVLKAKILLEDRR